MLSTKIANIDLPTCISNASGPNCTTRVDLSNLKSNPYTGILLTKSCTLEPRLGNLFPRYYENKNSSINSTGLANLGVDFYLSFPLMENHPEENSVEKNLKPYFMSVSGLSVEENLKILEKIYETTDIIQGIELNLSCPNVIGKPQIGYDFEAVDSLLGKIHNKFYQNEADKTSLPNIPLGLKLPPYFDMVHCQTLAKIILKYTDYNFGGPMIKFVTCINSLGNGLIINPQNESVVIKPKDGFGGIGGEIIKPIALSNVRQFYLLLKDEGIQIIGCGGIVNGWDAFEHILCGASAVQIGTQFQKEGQGCFQRITEELIEIMKNKGYKKITDFQGKLQTLD